MAHQLLYRADVHSSHHQTARERVPEIVPAHAFDLGLFECGRVGAVQEVAGIAWTLAAYRLAVLEFHRFGRKHQLGPGAARQLPQDRPHGVIHWHPAQLAAFGPRNGDHARGEVDVVPAKVELLALAQPGVDREGDQRPVGGLHGFA
ncbi:MAG TPA: hypothetical protein VN634_02415 [Candidatus Limnocylindrales bacterium]|nr:hypothetical protein [Candidatus Limnocylindrales bacterium]